MHRSGPRPRISSQTSEERPTLSQLAALYKLDLGDLSEAARAEREARHGPAVQVRHLGVLHCSNYCYNACKHCGWGQRGRRGGGEVLAPAELARRAEWLSALGVDTLQVFGGARNLQPLEYYEQALTRVMEAVGDRVEVEALSPSLVFEISRLEGTGVADVLVRLAEIGIRRLGPMGADVLVPDVRRHLFPRKLTAGNWVYTMEVAHQMGLRSDATLLFGHLETAWDKGEHLALLWDTQDETRGFDTYEPVPLASRRLDQHPPKVQHVWRELAVGRLALNNFDHLGCVYAPPMNIEGIAFAPSYGADRVSCVTKFRVEDEEPRLAPVGKVLSGLADVGWQVWTA